MDSLHPHEVTSAGACDAAANSASVADWTDGGWRVSRRTFVTSQHVIIPIDRYVWLGATSGSTGMRTGPTLGGVCRARAGSLTSIAPCLHPLSPAGLAHRLGAERTCDVSHSCNLEFRLVGMRPQLHVDMCLTIVCDGLRITDNDV